MRRLRLPAVERLTARFAVRYDDRPGMWMLHCHILDHADAGMMGMIDVLPDPGAAHAH
jgi:FtsP/CotA-like multicopper oxidase with cupredoxin domain